MNKSIDYSQELKRDVSTKSLLTPFQKRCFEKLEETLNQPVKDLKKLYDEISYRLMPNPARDLKMYEFLREAKQLIEKETSKKPIIKKFKESEHYICPNCRNHRFGILDYGEYKNEFRKGSNLTLYCPNCGQRLDWSEEVCHQK